MENLVEQTHLMRLKFCLYDRRRIRARLLAAPSHKKLRIFAVPPRQFGKIVHGLVCIETWKSGGKTPWNEGSLELTPAFAIYSLRELAIVKSGDSAMRSADLLVAVNNTGLLQSQAVAPKFHRIYSVNQNRFPVQVDETDVACISHPLTRLARARKVRWLAFDRK